MVVDFIASRQVLPPSSDAMIPSLDIRMRFEWPGWTAYSITIRPPFESVNGVFVQVLAFALMCEPLSMSPLTKRPSLLTAIAHGAMPRLGDTSLNEAAPSLER